MNDIARMRVEQERARLTHPLATFSASSRGRALPERDDPLRTCFERDGHRILHSKPFRRLRNKTQVFFSPENDHITTRMDHSLYVATIAATICRALGLNDDLAYAAALGHDLGHSAFGHSGEHILRRLLNRDRAEGQPRRRYHHEAQSLRVVDKLSTINDAAYRGLNLTYEVRDAIRCHCGESVAHEVFPRGREEVDDPATFRGLNVSPYTLEGCVVRVTDRIAYLGRDYEDALVALERLPPLPSVVVERLGTDNRQIINHLVADVIAENRREPGRIGFSATVAEAMRALRDFNYTHIYSHPLLEENRRRMDIIITRLFDEFTGWLSYGDPADWGQAEAEAPDHIHKLAYFAAGVGYDGDEDDAAQVAVDFIALMTDGFAFKMFQSLALPRPVV